MRDESARTSPWVWVAVGCGGLVVLGVVAVAAVGFLGYRWAKDVERTLKDPSARSERVMEILGAEELPEGYHPMLGMSIPLLMDVAMLSDKEPAAGEEPQGFEERGFIYIKMISFGRQSQELQDYFEGKTDDASILRRNNINIRPSEILERGTIERENDTLLYLVQRGSVGAFGTEHEGLTALVIVRCPGERRTHMGIWFAPDPGAQAGEGTQLAGSPADPAAIRSWTTSISVAERPPVPPAPPRHDSDRSRPRYSRIGDR